MHELKLRNDNALGGGGHFIVSCGIRLELEIYQA